MPKDLKIVWDTDEYEGDLYPDEGDLTTDDGLETAVIISLFTDRRAGDEDELLSSDDDDKRGWWGDQASPDVEGDEIGSKLWLLGRSKTTDQNLIKAKRYAEEALQWMIDDQISPKIEVTTERAGNIGQDILGLGVKVYKKDGTTEYFRYDLHWTGQFN